MIFYILFFFLLLLLIFYFKRSPKPETTANGYAEGVLPHDKAFSVHVPGRLWSIDGSLPNARPPFPRKMIIYRLGETDKLWVLSPFCLNAELTEEVEKMGTVSFIVVPNRYHTLDYARWKQRWPEAILCAPQNIIKQIDPQNEHHFRSCEALVESQDWPGISLLFLSFNFELSFKVELFLDIPSTAVIVTDLIWNLEKGKYGFLVDSVLRSSGGLKITPIGRFFLWAFFDQELFVKQLDEGVCQDDSIRFLLMAHGNVVDARVQAQVYEKIIKVIRK